MKVTVNATGFLPGLHYKILQDFLELRRLFGLRVKTPNDGAHILHLRLDFPLVCAYSNFPSRWV